MSSSKLLSLFIFLAVFAASVIAEEQEVIPNFIPKNVIVGYREPHDYIIDRQVIKKQGQFLWYIKYEKTFVGDNHSIITQIRLFDLDTRGGGAIAKIIAGGPGDSFVTLSIKSLLNRGINFGVEIYGKEPTGEQ